MQACHNDIWLIRKTGSDSKHYYFVSRQNFWLILQQRNCLHFSQHWKQSHPVIWWLLSVLAMSFDLFNKTSNIFYMHSQKHSEEKSRLTCYYSGTGDVALMFTPTPLQLPAIWNNCKLSAPLWLGRSNVSLHFYVHSWVYSFDKHF